ncbi:MAG: branched-chain amino acid ABC transporter permease [Thermodesulfobacteriota bacterium]
MDIILQALVSGILMGAIYGAIAAGLALIYGVMRIINFAHGELLMIGMFIVYGGWQMVGIDPYLYIVPAGIILFGVGYGIQKGLINPAIQKTTEREPLSILLITAGLSMILINVGILLLSDYPKMLQTPYSLETLKAGGIRISVSRFISFTLSLVTIAVLYLILAKTELGRQMRATSQDRAAARLMGIDEPKIYSLSFAIGAAVTGVAGALLAPIFFIKPSVGHVYVMKSFIIVVLGGMGSVPGALIAGLMVGIIESVGSLLMNPVYAEAMVFFLFILFLLIRPSGLLGKERM